MLRLIILFFCLSVAGFSNAAINNFGTGSRSSSLGNASVTLFDVWSAHNNQAGLGLIDKISAGLYYENKFLISQTGYKAIALAYPTATGVFGLDVTSFGYSGYYENKYGLGFGKKLSDKISVGVQINYNDIYLGEYYGRSGYLIGEVGMIVRWNDHFTIGAHVYNPSRAQLNTATKEYAPTILKLGCAYKFNDKVMLVAEVEKDVEYDPQFKSGIEYHISDPLYFRIGISTSPLNNSFGIGYRVKNLSIDVSSSYHTVLGFSPNLSLSYNF